MPHLSACSCDWEKSKGTVKTASVTSEPRADWAVSVKKGIISSSSFGSAWIQSICRSLAFHVEEDGFGSVNRGHILGLLSRLDFIVWISLSVDHLDKMSRKRTDSRGTLSMEHIQTQTECNCESDTSWKVQSVSNTWPEIRRFLHWY